MATSFYADELIGTITNAQWFLFVPALLILILPAEKPERSPGRVTWVAAGLVFLIGLSAPLVAILLPVAVSPVTLTPGTGLRSTAAITLSMAGALVTVPDALLITTV